MKGRVRRQAGWSRILACYGKVSCGGGLLLRSTRIGYNKLMKGRLIIIILGLLFGICLLGTRSFRAQIHTYKVSNREDIPFEQLISEISKADIIFTGEVHNSERHHRLQLETIRGLSEAGIPVAVGLEIFPKKSQATLDGWVAGSVSPEDFKRFYETHWKQPWPLFRDLFLYAREHGIPLFALNIPQEISQKVRQTGFLSLSEEELKQLPPGIGCNVDEKYMQFIQRVFALHKNDDKAFVNFCEAQLLWDKSMAWHLLEFQRAYPGRTIVAITGINHAWKRGIPYQLSQYSGESNFLVLLPEIPGTAGPGTLTLEDTDYIFLK
jgi:uncharacterized iron-regulated protein